MQRSDPPRHLQRLALILAVAAWMLHLIAPPGFMPRPAAGPGLAPLLVICDGQDAVSGAGKVPAGDKQRTEHICPFAACAGAAPPPAAPAQQTPPAGFILALAPPPMPDLALSLGLAAPPPPSQGPPSALA